MQISLQIIVFGEHGRHIGNINHLWRCTSFSPTGSGSVLVTNGGSSGIMSTARLELPYPRISQAKFRDEISRREK